MSNADGELSSSDRVLMRALADAIGGPQPPIDLAARCEGLVAWIDVDSELAALLDTPVAEAAGTRGATISAGSLEFTLADGSCVIEVTCDDEGVRGQVLGGEANTVVVRTTTDTTQAGTVDDLGVFEINKPPTGTIRLEFDLAEGRRIHTDWFVI